MPFDKEDTETQGLDIEAATAEISSDLFGQGGDEDEVAGSGAEEEELSDGSETVDVAASSSATEDDQEEVVTEAVVEEGQQEAENSAEVQETGAPKTWTKEALAKWATVDPVVQAEILKREEDFLKGITGYKQAADLGVRYSQVVEPYGAMLAAEKIDPVQLFQSFAGNHYLLSRGTPQQKVEVAANLLNGYGIPLADLLNHIAEVGEAEPVDPKYAALEKRIDELTKAQDTRVSAESQAIQSKINQEIEDFAKDPANIYFDELAADISQIFAAGGASTLKEAYDKAVWANPGTREKELARRDAEKVAAQQAEEQKRKDKIASRTADSVNVRPSSRDATIPKGSIDDTLSETMAAITSRG